MLLEFWCEQYLNMLCFGCHAEMSETKLLKGSLREANFRLETILIGRWEQSHMFLYYIVDKICEWLTQSNVLCLRRVLTRWYEG